MEKFVILHMAYMFDNVAKYIFTVCSPKKLNCSPTIIKMDLCQLEMVVSVNQNWNYSCSYAQVHTIDKF